MNPAVRELRTTLRSMKNAMALGGLSRARFEWMMAKAFEALELIEIADQDPPPVINGRFTVIQGDRP